MNLAALQLIAKSLAALEAAASIYSTLSSSHEKVKAIMAEDRDPTPEEWEELTSQLQANSDIIQGA